MIPRHWIRCSRWFVCSVILVLTIVHRGDARPNYKKCFDLVYKDKLKNNKVTCAVCHSGDGKKQLNHYGKAIAEELGERNVKDEEKIIAAIKAVAKRKCKSGEWSERVERGQLPCECGECDAASYLTRQLNRAGDEGRKTRDSVTQSFGEGGRSKKRT